MSPAPDPWERGQEEAPVRQAWSSQRAGQTLPSRALRPRTSTSPCRPLEGKQTSTTDKLKECV